MIWRSTYDLMTLAWDEGARAEGQAKLAEGLNLAVRSGNRLMLAWGLLLAAEHSAKEGALIRAVRMFSAAEAIVPSFQSGLDVSDPAAFARSLTAARAKLPNSLGASAVLKTDSATQPVTPAPVN